ncbi:hypothetical protein H8E77_15915 [bacterium]|nr:hypothetical protein [bacterium]
MSNAASIGVMARQIMAREWAKALGRYRPRPVFDERNVKQWLAEQEEKKRKLQEEEALRQQAAAVLVTFNAEDLTYFLQLHPDLEASGERSERLEKIAQEIPPESILSALAQLEEMKRLKQLEEEERQKRYANGLGAVPADWCKEIVLHDTTGWTNNLEVI